MKHLRRAAISDEAVIRQLHLAAFGEEEGPVIGELATKLLKEPSEPEILNLVAVEEERLVGHIAFSPVHAKQDGALLGYLLAPLAVRPGDQRKGVGRALVGEGLRELKERGRGLILVYGDPAYYGRFGFNADFANRFRPPFDLARPSGWQAMASTGKVPSGPPVDFTCVEALNRPELW